MKGRHKPRLGQHFLRDPVAIGRIVAAINPKPGELLVEIGPGEGVITEPVLHAAGAVTAIELDRNLAGALRARYPEGALHLIEADALNVDYDALAPTGGRMRVYGNLPYYLSTPLLFRLLACAAVSEMLFMLQREVVDRLAAEPGTAQWGRLSVMTQYRCTAQALFTVPPGAFAPPPKVQSRVVRLTPHNQPPHVADDPKALSAVVAAAFSQRRKTIRNAVAALLPESALRAAQVDPQTRPQQLDVAAYVRLANQLTQLRG